MEEKSSLAAGVFAGLNVVPLVLEGVVKLTLRTFEPRFALIDFLSVRSFLFLVSVP